MGHSVLVRPQIANMKWGVSCIGQCGPFSRLFHFLWSNCGRTGQYKVHNIVYRPKAISHKLNVRFNESQIIICQIVGLGGRD